MGQHGSDFGGHTRHALAHGSQGGVLAGQGLGARQALFWPRRDCVCVETTIRELGGLLAAYDLSKDPAFLNKAKELGDKLAPAFGTSTGVAWGMVDFHSGRGGGGWAGSSAILSEFGTLQIEFRNLAAYTHNPHYENIAMRGL